LIPPLTNNEIAIINSSSVLKELSKCIKIT
jgi:hypothetical protein